ncbi:MAG TPA: hypothetical protein VFU97_24400 [Xanthobacteraceae bacterium]|nr:hypothetical protein [Xanthobacteraceae bacterium]
MAFERTVQIFAPGGALVADYRLRRTAWKDAAWWRVELGEHLPADKVADAGAFAANVEDAVRRRGYRVIEHDREEEAQEERDGAAEERADRLAEARIREGEARAAARRATGRR